MIEPGDMVRVNSLARYLHLWENLENNANSVGTFRSRDTAVVLAVAEGIWGVEWATQVLVLTSREIVGWTLSDLVERVQ